ncbi:phage terminase large subunit family protein, partial [Planococcus sp. SIMBA_143]
VGKTEIILNTVGYHIDFDPAPIMLMQPTLDLAKNFSKERLAPMLRDTPALRNKVADVKTRDGGNTTLQKSFAGGYIALVG